MAMVMAILVATTMETVVTGIVIITIQGVAPVIGDKMKEQRGKLLTYRGLPPCSGDIPSPITSTSLFPRLSGFPPCSRSARRGFAQAGEVPCRERIDAFPGVLTSFDPCRNK
jgi:hypothetical protein